MASSRAALVDWSDITEGSTVALLVRLHDARSVLVVVAHRDDESYGLGAAIATFCESGIATAVLCFTHGEASTLGADYSDLGRVRASELAAAADVLGVDSVELLDYRDGYLAEVPLEKLSAHVRASIARRNVDLLLVFEKEASPDTPTIVEQLRPPCRWRVRWVFPCSRGP